MTGHRIDRSDAPRPVEVILNAGSGRTDAAESVGRIEEAVTGAGREVRITLVRHGGEIAPSGRDAMERGTSALVAAGGDGTVSALAGVAAGSGVPFGVLPLGTLNHFARDMGIPSGLEAALAVVVGGVTREVDVGEVCGRVFVNNASLGVYPRILRLRERYRARGPGKWLVALWATLSVLRRRPFVAVRVVADGQPVLRRTPFVFVGNNEYRMEGVQAGSREALDRGVLALYTMNASGRRSLLWLAARIVFGRARQVRELDSFLLREATIELRRRRIGVALDGELGELTPPLEFRSRPGALRVLVPALAPSGEAAFIG